MNIQKALPYINAHRQKYLNSCSPSLVEMMLKISGAVNIDYYEEQDRDQNENVGLKNIRDKTIQGKTFRKFDSQKQGSLLDFISLELANEKVLGVYLPVGGNFHGFVIVGLDAHNLYLLSKCSEMKPNQGRITISSSFPIAQIDALINFDCIFYENN